MKPINFILALTLLAACGQPSGNSSTSDSHIAADGQTTAELQHLAEQYVRLGLTVGLYDGDFVDAYYGPDSLKPAARPVTDSASFPKDSLLAAVKQLSQQLDSVRQKTAGGDSATKMLSQRAAWMQSQLTAFDRRIRIFSGELSGFDEESKGLFGVVAPQKSEAELKTLVAKLDSTLPGKGNVGARFQQLANRFIIPKTRLDTVFKTAIAECRKRTLQHYSLPPSESFTLEYVNNKPWNGYNWYKGNYRSVIQINTDIQIFIDRAIDVGSHESYPGHHVYNMLLEKNLYRDRGWVEISLYPLFSPQSLIAEGSANYGISLVFPGEEKVAFAREKLLPLAGLDTTGIAAYFRALEIKDELNYARNEAARGLINGTMTEAAAKQWMMSYALMNEETAAKSVSFIRRNRSYVINYNYGKDLVRQYIERPGAGPDERWTRFGLLLSNPVTPGEMGGK
ncbi:hypothetical protein [Flavihumibacter petaseus]|uniref:DUF885 domain-containing protein n=1 Tax=Flavihumibacter petaseus NBRC 106054 TaxID=1220578 RepID=A0A0E9MX45_9BACT|nr:hypothetical protein [Flavihumibacter petaseus]GAO42159.1 hypothetical protein FPE01S_01_11720 [Flavihumibacter petaseus NBRC 106054]